MHLHLTLNNHRLSEFTAREKNAIHEDTPPLVDVVGHIHAIVACRGCRSLKGRVGKAVVEVIIQQDVAVLRNFVIRKRLARPGVERGKLIV